MALQWTLQGMMMLMVVALALATLCLMLKVADLREQLDRSSDALDNQRMLSACALKDLAEAETALRAERLQHERTRHKYWLLEQLVPALQPAPRAGSGVLVQHQEADADKHVG
jgi:hypothetical protein